MGTPAASAAARAALAAEGEIDRASALAIDDGLVSFHSNPGVLKLVQNRAVVSDQQAAGRPALLAYVQAERAYTRALAELERELGAGAQQLHATVRDLALAVLPDFALLESESILARVVSGE